MHLITKGATSQSLDIFIQDSASTTGAGKTGLAFNTASLVAYYRRGATGSTTAITLATLANAQAAWSSGGFVEVDATNQPGMYRLDVPDAVLASGVNRAQILLKGASGMAPVAVGITLTSADLQDSVRAGLTSLPNAAAEAAGGMYTRGTGAGQINQPANGMVDTNVVRNAGTAITASSGRQEVNTTHLAGSAVDQSGGLINANVKQISGDATAADNEEAFFDGTGYAGTNNVIPTVTTLTNAPSDSSGVTTLLSRIPSGLFTGITSLAQWLGLIAGKQTGNSTARTEIRATGAGSGTFDETTDSTEAIRDNQGTAQTGDSFARIGAPAGASVSADVAAVKVDTDAVKVVTDKVTTAFELDGSVYRLTTNALEQAPTGGGAADGSGFTSIPWNPAWDAEVQSEAADALNAYDPPTKAELDSAVAPLSTLNAAGVRTAVGLATANLDTQLDALPTNAELSTALGTADDAVLAAIAALNNLSAAGVRTAIGLATANLDTQLAAIDTKTTNLPTDPADESLIIAATNAIATAIAALNNLSAAQVNAQVVDALAVDTYGEPTAVPAATATLAAKINWLTVLARNAVTQTSTTQSLKDNAGTGDIATAAVSDDGTTFQRSKWT